MEEVLKSDYCSIKFDAEKLLIEHTWLLTTENMTDEEFRKVCSFWKDFCIENQVKYNLLDTREFIFTVSTDTQDWLANNIVAPTVGANMQKMATILPEGDIFAQVSVEQAMEENQEQGGLPSKYFDNIEEARSWLLS